MADKVFVPLNRCKRHDFSNGGYVINIGGKADELAKFIQQNANAQGFINLTLCERKTPSKGGDTHYAILDTYGAEKAGYQQKPKTTTDEAP